MKVQSRTERFFTEEERERIRVAAIQAESQTIGEIATVVVDQSSEYREAELMGGIVTASLVSLIITGVFFHASVWSFIPFAFILFFPCRILFRRVPELKGVFVGRRRKEAAVRDRAVRTFYDKGLYRTKANTGVLFFLSLFERKVWVLADKGIHGKMQQPTLDTFAAMVSKGIRDGRACEALMEAIMGIGELLAQYYPISDADTNELPNEVMCEPDSPCQNGQ
jgi:putative membrane protein